MVIDEDYVPSNRVPAPVTAEQMQEFVRNIAMGATFKKAAEKAGVSRRRLWTQTQKDSSFWNAVKNAVLFAVQWDVVDKTREIEAKIETGQLTAAQGAAILNSLYWKAEHIDKTNFSKAFSADFSENKTNVQINVISFKDRRRALERKEIKEIPPAPNEVLIEVE